MSATESGFTTGSGADTRTSFSLGFRRKVISFFQNDGSPGLPISAPRQTQPGRNGRRDRLDVSCAVEQPEQLVRIARAAERDLGGDRPAQHELAERLLHRL